jgi:hypothetical protein
VAVAVADVLQASADAEVDLSGFSTEIVLSGFSRDHVCRAPREVVAAARAALDCGWAALPVPTGDRDKMERLSGDVPLEDFRGIHVALTVGNEVLRSRSSRPLSEVARPNDLILGVLDTDSNTLYARAASGY